MPNYDVIVAGCGALGSAALYHLASQGFKVLGLDRFPPGHDRGSSHGETRVIRQAYFEHPDYVPLLKQAYELWAALEEAADEQLYHQTGVLQIGPAQGELISGVLKSARLHNLPIQQLNSQEFSNNFPGFVLPDGHQAVLEKRGGYLKVEDSIRACARLAQSAGAQLVCGETITDWSADASGVTVTTDTNSYNAAGLILTVGAWANDLLPGLSDHFQVLRKHLYWYANDDIRYRRDHSCPVFFYEIDGRSFYGFPQSDAQGVKVSEHTNGTMVADPLSISRTLDLQDRDQVESFMRAHLPGVSGQMTRHEVCMYTMSPDGHFIVDHWPGADNVAFAAGLSGHGFKFASVLGKRLAEMVVDVKNTDLDFLSLERLRR